MPSPRLTRAVVAQVFVAGLVAGCGSSAPSDGKQVNVTIPKDEAQKQNNAYQDYMKQAKKKPGR